MLVVRQVDLYLFGCSNITKSAIKQLAKHAPNICEKAQNGTMSLN